MTNPRKHFASVLAALALTSGSLLLRNMTPSFEKGLIVIQIRGKAKSYLHFIHEDGNFVVDSE